MCISIEFVIASKGVYSLLPVLFADLKIVIPRLSCIVHVKCIQEAHLRVVDAVGGTVRAATVGAAEASRLERTGLCCDGEGNVELMESDENVPLVTDNSRDGRVTVEQGEPWPFTLLMLETDLELEHKDGDE